MNGGAVGDRNGAVAVRKDIEGSKEVGRFPVVETFALGR